MGKKSEDVSGGVRAVRGQQGREGETQRAAKGVSWSSGTCVAETVASRGRQEGALILHLGSPPPLRNQRGAAPHEATEEGKQCF